SNKLYEIN
ncbi:hypothetical protein D043_0502B, partial [Vibrio parahaemolyticus EKP-021]